MLLTSYFFKGVCSFTDGIVYIVGIALLRFSWSKLEDFGSISLKYVSNTQLFKLLVKQKHHRPSTKPFQILEFGNRVKLIKMRNVRKYMEKLQKWFGLVGNFWSLFILFLLGGEPKLIHAGGGGPGSASGGFPLEHRGSVSWISPKPSMLSSKASIPDSTSMWLSFSSSFLASGSSSWTKNMVTIKRENI